MWRVIEKWRFIKFIVGILTRLRPFTRFVVNVILMKKKKKKRSRISR